MVQRRHAVALRGVHIAAFLDQLSDGGGVFGLRGIGDRRARLGLSRRSVRAKADAKRASESGNDNQREKFLHSRFSEVRLRAPAARYGGSQAYAAVFAGAEFRSMTELLSPKC
ncbi:MAG TPA: hypothetical protein VH835_17900, partial [Dongiaceae bacterium]